MATFLEEYKLYRESTLEEFQALIALHKARGGTWQDLILDAIIEKDEDGCRIVRVLVRKWPNNKKPLTEQEREDLYKEELKIES